ncbi:unnamed protein product [Effrenium voratum]|uniref:Uncharacterized protein n=1 Tax=Effrenium voratum TaxID=2562239 RepID=A0AA36IYG1_9DINO|nr:unnamed protein product [Effrenium voratum]CAJ1395906.1 unnamed protein product [Effrenium voratum]CAJ1427226.1 unnamed protein product [Effrenium voratum]
MKGVAALLALGLAGLAPAITVLRQEEAVAETAASSPCDGQCRFDIMMCKSFMCTECTYEWCTEACQKVQKDFPGLRCADWPEARTSFSNGDFKNKGKLGDGGDFAEKK